MKIDLINLLEKNFVEKNIKINSETIESKTKNQFTKPIKIKRKIKIDEQVLYALGLWEGDKYIYGGSVGLTNTSSELLQEFKEFIKKIIKNQKSIKEISINSGTAKRIYLNSWLLKRILEKLTEKIERYIKSKEDLLTYLSGKIDADGTIMVQNFYSKSGLIKITYGSKKEAEKDKKLLEKFKLKASIIPYKDRNAYDLKITYLSSFEILNHLKLKNPEKQIKLLILKGLTRR